MPYLIPNFKIVMGTKRGKVKAPISGVKAIKFFFIIYSNHSVSALDFSLVLSKGVSLLNCIVIDLSCSPVESVAFIS